jgi:hypothetical protein
MEVLQFGSLRHLFALAYLGRVILLVLADSTVPKFHESGRAYSGLWPVLHRVPKDQMCAQSF